MPDAVRLGIVGCGGIAQAHLKGYEALVEEGYDRVAVTAVCDLNRESAEAAAERVGASMGTRP
ncbi:MAG: hypothetical protein U9R79_04040, partial [Armatimonadota bacterium]|nr:hypothetical protein [Armatimonadota bacterium]